MSVCVSQCELQHALQAGVGVKTHTYTASDIQKITVSKQLINEAWTSLQCAGRYPVSIYSF